MIKRLTWWATGAVMGAGGSAWVQRKLRKTMARFSPPAIAGTAKGVAKELGQDLRSVLSEGRQAMKERETQLREQLRNRGGQA